MWDLFLSESEENLLSIENALLSTEANGQNKEDIDSIYRNFHTLKGNARVMGLSELENVIHLAEDLIDLVRDSDISIDLVSDILFFVLDSFRGIYSELNNNKTDISIEKAKMLNEKITNVLIMYQNPAHFPENGIEVLLVPDDKAIFYDQLPESKKVLPSQDPLYLSIYFEMIEADLSKINSAVETFFEEAESDFEPIQNMFSRWINASNTIGFDNLSRAIEEIEEQIGNKQWEEFNLKLSQFILLFNEAKNNYLNNFSPDTKDECILSLEDNNSISDNLPETNVAETIISSQVDKLYIRIESSKVNQLMDLVGEISLVSGALLSQPEIKNTRSVDSQVLKKSMESLLSELQEETSGLRLVPIGAVFKRINRLVRDLEKKTGKNLNLEVWGDETEIDKAMVDKLYEPLAHIIRNAVDHGIESESERQKLGKKPFGTIKLKALHQNGEIIISVEDDGSGLDRKKIIEQAIKAGLLEKDLLPEENLINNLIFQPGFSTATETSKLSGRGVGMDVVKHTINGLRGRIKIESRENEGTRIIMYLPLTLAFIEGMIVGVSDKLFVIPIVSISEVFRLNLKQITTVKANNSNLIKVRDKLIPICSLNTLFNEDTDNLLSNEKIIIIVNTSDGSIAIPVDKLIGNQQITLKPLTGFLKGIKAGSGFGLLVSGDVAVVLDCERLHAD
jgi:two-component system chemotaxis sensor kinase CheA